MKKIKTGVIGCTGLVGQRFVKMLDSHPFFEIAALSSSRKSEGKRYREAVDWIVGGDIPYGEGEIVITSVSPGDLIKKGLKVIFSALPPPVAQDLEKVMSGKGLCVFSNASAFRMEPDVPILIPEVNPDHLELIDTQRSHGNGFIVTNSNCTATGLVLGLKPLLNFGIRSVTVTTYQSLSGAGRRGVPSLDIIDNLIPYIRDEEEKIEQETKKILGRICNTGIKDADLEVDASCCRVPTRDGHLESVIVEFEEDVNVETISDALSSFRGIPQELNLPTAPEVPIILRHEENRPQPILDREAGTPDRAKGMAVSVGRIRKKGKKVNFFLLVHNTIRGAAGTCILNAELAVRRGYIR